MNRDWKSIALAQHLPLSEAELASLVSTMQALEAAFQPLVAALPFETEPATILSPVAVQGSVQLP